MGGSIFLQDLCAELARAEAAHAPMHSLHACVRTAARRGLLPGRDGHVLGFRDTRRGIHCVLIGEEEHIVHALLPCSPTLEAWLNGAIPEEHP